MSGPIQLIFGLFMAFAGLVFVLNAIRDQDSMFHWKGDFAPGGPKRRRVRIIYMAMGLCYLMSGLGNLYTFAVASH